MRRNSQKRCDDEEEHVASIDYLMGREYMSSPQNMDDFLTENTSYNFFFIKRAHALSPNRRTRVTLSEREAADIYFAGRSSLSSPEKLEVFLTTANLTATPKETDDGVLTTADSAAPPKETTTKLMAPPETTDDGVSTVGNSTTPPDGPKFEGAGKVYEEVKLLFDGVGDTATKTYDRKFDGTIGAPTGRIDGVSSATSRKDTTAEWTAPPKHSKAPPANTTEISTAQPTETDDGIFTTAEKKKTTIVASTEDSTVSLEKTMTSDSVNGGLFQVFLGKEADGPPINSSLAEEYFAREIINFQHKIDKVLTDDEYDGEFNDGKYKIDDDDKHKVSNDGKVDDGEEYYGDGRIYNAKLFKDDNSYGARKKLYHGEVKLTMVPPPKGSVLGVESGRQKFCAGEHRLCDGDERFYDGGRNIDESKFYYNGDQNFYGGDEPKFFTMKMKKNFTAKDNLMKKDRNFATTQNLNDETFHEDQKSVYDENRGQQKLCENKDFDGDKQKLLFDGKLFDGNSARQKVASRWWFCLITRMSSGRRCGRIRRYVPLDCFATVSKIDKFCLLVFLFYCFLFLSYSYPIYFLNCYVFCY